MSKTLKFFVVAAMVLSACTLTAQNTFKGIVKYEVKSTGEIAVNIPAEQAKMEIRIMGDKLIYQNMLQEGMKLTMNLDLSQAIAYLAANDIELASYSGNGKLLIEEEQKQSEIDSMFIVDTEPGHYYIELVNGETNKIAGYTCKKAIRHNYDEDGKDHPITIWYSEELGPRYNFLFASASIVTPGMPRQFTVTGEGGKAITYTATEVVKGKVKDVDFLLPSGFTKTSEEDYKQIMQELQDAIQLLSD